MRAAILVLVLVGAACGKGEPSGPMGDVISAWKQAGLDPSSFEPVDAKDLGGTCRAGKVKGLDTTVCEYSDAAAAKRAEAAGLAQVGETTGAAIAQGRVLLVIADRGRADPNGKSIKEIAKVFRNR
jgi:hypothetical protein